MPASVTSSASAGEDAEQRRGQPRRRQRRSQVVERPHVLDRQIRIDRVTASRAMRVAERGRIAGRAHEHLAGEAERRLRQRQVDLRRRVAAEAELPHVADDADDGEPRLRRCSIEMRVPIGSRAVPSSASSPC